MVRVRLPAHLRTLVQLEKETELGSGPGTGSEVRLQLDSPRTQSSLLDALETRYPVLLGTIRDPRTRVRRPFIRFFACEEDLSHESPDSDLPTPVLAGTEPFVILGAMAGG
ncbi:MAG: MoaD/ThiS family protein [Acidimicrobiales bacterium]